VRAYAFPVSLQNWAFILKIRSCGDLIQKALHLPSAYMPILATHEDESGHSTM
jgi:hypothetical protein